MAGQTSSFILKRRCRIPPGLLAHDDAVTEAKREARRLCSVVEAQDKDRGDAGQLWSDPRNKNQSKSSDEPGREERTKRRPRSRWTLLPTPSTYVLIVPAMGHGLRVFVVGCCRRRLAGAARMHAVHIDHIGLSPIE
jgi:hypothetical protein